MSRVSAAVLVLARGRGSRSRLAAVSAGVAVGVMLILLLWGGFNALAVRAERASWTLTQSGMPLGGGSVPMLTDSQLVSSVQVDHFSGHTVTQVTVAANQSSHAHIPGVEAIPVPGTLYASPAMMSLIAQAPPTQLGDRYGTSVGLIGNDALTGPDSLVIVVGQTISTASALPNAQIIDGHYSFWDSAFATSGYRAVALVGAIAIMLPVLLLVGIVNQLGAAQRAERLSSLRLIGATPAFVAGLSVSETPVTSLIGAVVGSLAAAALVPLEAQVTIENTRFFIDDLLASPMVISATIIGTVGLTGLVAWARARRAPLGPLGVTRAASEKPPKLISLLPLTIGLCLMVGITIVSVTRSQQLFVLMGTSPVSLTLPLLLAGFVLTAIGILAAGPLLIRWVATTGLLNVRDGGTLIALNRIRHHPRLIFRGVGGLVAALFFISVFAGAATTATDTSTTSEGSGYLPAGTLTAVINYTTGVTASEVAAAEHVLASVPGTRHTALGLLDPSSGLIFHASDLRAIGLPVTGEGLVHVDNGVDANTAAVVTPIPQQDISTLPPAALWIATDESSTAIERARTALIGTRIPLMQPPTTRTENNQSSLLDLVNRYRSLANLGIIVATAIAAVSLTISTTVSIVDRKRVLGILRLTGMNASALRRIIVIETMLPILAVFVGCIALGMLSAWCVVAAPTGGARTISWPDTSYYAVILVSLGLAATAAISSFGSARATTTIASTRFE